MNLKKIITSSALIVTPVLFASDYQSEAGVAYFDADGGSFTVITGQYHFDLVDTSNTALAEASFFERENNVSVALTVGDLEIQQIAAEFYFDKIYVAPSYTNIDLGFVSADTFAVDLGYSPYNGLRFSTFVPESNYDANLSVKYVGKTSNDRTFNIEATATDNDFIVGGDYYFDRTMGAGLSISEDEITLSGDKFFTDKFRGGLSFTDTDVGNIIGIDVSMRF